jgi:hypothetical protein
LKRFDAKDTEANQGVSHVGERPPAGFNV